MKKVTEYAIYAALIAALMAAGAWFVDGVLRLILLAVLYFVEMEILVSIVRLVLNEPEPRKMTAEEEIRAEEEWYRSRQDISVMYRMQTVGQVVNGAAIAAAVLTVLLGVSTPIGGLACLGCSIVSVALCIRFPAYFSLSHSEKEKNRKCSFPIVNLMLPCFCPAVAIMPYLYHVCLPDWLAVMEAGLMAAAVIGMVLRLALRELRRYMTEWIAVMALLVVFSAGFVLPLNQALDTAEPQQITATVLEYDTGGRRSPDHYKVQLESGEEISIPEGGFFPRVRYWPGDEVELEYHEGGLGIPYYCYPEE